MTDPIVLICSLTGCDEDDARRAYEKTQDTVNAVELILGPLPNQKFNPRKRRRTMTEDEEYITNLRPTMEEIDRNAEKMVTEKGQRESSGSVEKISPHEEKVQQNSCVQECQIPSVESEAEIQEIEYQ